MKPTDSTAAITYRPGDQKREQCYHDGRGHNYYIDANGTEHRYQVIDGKIAIPLN